MTPPSRDLPTVHIRRATAADVALIVEFLHEDVLGAGREDPGPPLPAAYLDAFAEIDADPRTSLFIAELDGERVGTFQFTVLRHLTHHGARVAQIEAVHVATRHRGRGIGEAMMRWAVDEARRRGCQRAQLTSDKRRADAHRFYLRLGFTNSHEGMKLPLPPDPDRD